jgi:putative NADH-flavin reductase
MKIAIVGASGNVGQRLVKEATERGHEVVAIARNPGSIEASDKVQVVQADVANPDEGAKALAGADAAILSVRFQGTDFDQVMDSVKKSGVPRVLIVGGAASLEIAPGQVLLDQPTFPDFIKPEAEPARQALNKLREEKEVDWTFLSPSMMFVPGERTGSFRLGKDSLLTADDGQSSISYEDYSIAAIDELENPQHSRQRFTVGY